MSDYKQAKEFYDYIIKNNGYDKMSMVWAISCVEESLQAFDMDLIITDEDKEKMCNLVLNTWLDTPYNIGISRLADLVVEHWSELKDNDESHDLLDEYISDEIDF